MRAALPFPFRVAQGFLKDSGENGFMASGAAGARVLVVDDEPIVREVLDRYLSLEGFEVETAADGDAALRSFESARPELVILDLMLPHTDGLEVFRRIRARAHTPVIMVTARGAETDRIVGLDLGADDYVAKPFSPREVVARVRAVMRRTANRGPVAAGERLNRLRFDGLEIDSRTREVLVEGRTVEMTPKEFDVLHLLASSPRAVFSRSRILDELWDVAFEGDPSTVTVHIRRLREKIEEDPSRPRRLVTVWGSGYRFEP
jgi:two-component system, OmpR family, response regulator ResD